MGKKDLNRNINVVQSGRMDCLSGGGGGVFVDEF